MSFARPWLLPVLLLLPLWWWWRTRRRAGPVRFSDLGLLGSAQLQVWRARLPVILRSLAAFLLLLAAAGPRRGGEEIQITQEGIAIVIALDISSSMLAEDFAPKNRFEVAKENAIGFIRGRRADRIGLVVFAGEAITQVPITVDYPVLEQAVRDLRMGVLEDGTAIGSGLATSLSRLRQAPGESKVVLLLTDGVNNRGLVDPRTAAEAAKALGVKVYTIGVGTDGEAPIPTGRGLSGFRYETLPVEIDEELMTEIAQSTGGRYFRARDAEALARVFRQIDELETTPIRVTRFARYEEQTRPLVALGLLLLAVELAVGATVAVRVP